MTKNLNELDELAKSYGFGGAHNAITCAKGYRDKYSEVLHKYNESVSMFKALKILLPEDMNNLIDIKLKELNIDING